MALSTLLRRIPATAAARRSVLRSSPQSAAFSTERPVARNASFASWTDDDVTHFRNVLGRPEAVLTELDDTVSYTVDWLKKYKAQSQHQLVLKPKTTEEVSEILKYCHARNLPVVPQGGNTGLVGGSVPVFDEIVLSTSAMNSVIDFDEVSGILVCEAGCILENLDNYVAKKGYMMPLDLGAKGTCQIGGNVSANAGGLRLLRYGSLHGTVLGVEAVLADGTIVDCLSTMRKDNTGYDLKQLFIGSEGTLGVVTKVSILTPPRSSSVNVALLGCEDFEAVQRTFVEAKKHLGEVLSAVEFMDRQSLDMVLSQQDWHKDPLETNCPYYILIETSGSNSTHDMEKLEGFLEEAMGSGTVVDGTVAQDTVQARKLFGIREDITLALSSRGYVYKYDLSLPISQYYQIVEETREKLAPLGAEVVCFGHLGDCNLHLNISTLAYNEKVFNEIEPFVFEFTSKYRGSISAEHGIGTHKPSYLHLSKSANAIKLMKQMKTMMDPKGILNPYKVLPEVVEE
uniref:FAD-binding PCMH-type domain-containing protein n=1 Tax=Globisporangium ultimum (strain ATCC 200006 / CBS 805.95 / DAOM BR144) TaxID=431595 RepID=K3WIE6_GLOUD